ncbi:MAG TPA: hypothetical protein VN901_24585 [Candidatus Acidoferrales bacterium]|nr:hypothetical protein [Candidatus Acidoferrales bacterium]
MISEGRILSIFRTKGGPGGSTSTADELSQYAKEFLEKDLKGHQALIARVESKDNWFAVSKSELVSGFKGHVRHTNLTDIMGVVSTPTQLLEVKRSGGPLELRLAGDSTLTLWLDGGRPFVGVLNVFNYIVKTTHGRRSGQGLVPTRKSGSIRETQESGM